MRPNENKMSCRERGRAWQRVEREVITENEVVRRLAVSSIAWLRLSKKWDCMAFFARQVRRFFATRFHAAIQAL